MVLIESGQLAVIRTQMVVSGARAASWAGLGGLAVTDGRGTVFGTRRPNTNPTAAGNRFDAV
jgi:hypothetical protein